MKISFTGTQGGMTIRQEMALEILLDTLLEEGDELHHGGCVGADGGCHILLRRDLNHYEVIIHIHWGDNPRKYMNVDRMTSTRKNIIYHNPKPNLERNKDVVNEGNDLLIAAPKTAREERRSGTWATVRYARKANVPVIILDP